MTVDSTARYRTDQAKNWVSFLVGDVRYAVEIHIVREIVNPLPVVPLPHAPAEVVGVADHRGEVLPVIDLRGRFGLPPVEATRRTKWIIVRVPGREQPVALVVDAVTDVFGAGQSEQRAIPQVGKGAELRGISSCYSHEGKLVFVVDPSIIASAADGLDTSSVLPPPQLGGPRDA
jgi:purine-binding chemotaxis protein CheW